MQSQAEQLSKSRKKFLATTYKHFPGALYTILITHYPHFVQVLMKGFYIGDDGVIITAPVAQGAVAHSCGGAV